MSEEHRYTHTYDGTGGGGGIGNVGIIELNTELKFDGTLSDVAVFLASTVSDIKASLKENELVEITKIFVENIGWLTPVGFYIFDSETTPALTDWINIHYTGDDVSYFSLNNLKGTNLTLTNTENADASIDYLLDDTIRVVMIYYNKYERRQIG